MDPESKGSSDHLMSTLIQMIRRITAANVQMKRFPKLLDLFHISVWERVVCKVESHGEKDLGGDWSDFPSVTFQVNQLDVLLVYILVHTGAVG